MKKIAVSLLSLLLTACTLFSFVSCSAVPGISAYAEELSENYQRTATEKGAVTVEFKIALSNFSFELFKGLATKDGNTNDLISPLSAVLCLALIANGASGETKQQLEETFGMDISSLNECLYAYTALLSDSKNCKLNLANSIWFRNEENRLHVNEEFLQKNADWYDAQIYAAPFDDSTLSDINNWCKRYTDGMIDQILDDISSDCVMYLINALVFDAKWDTEYEKSDIVKKTFTGYNNKKVKTDFLHSVETSYIQGDHCCGFKKSYADNLYSFVGILPDEDTDIYDFIDSLSGEKWLELLASSDYYPVNVFLPEFTSNQKMKLNDVLKEMGITDLFDPEKSDLSELGYSKQGNLFCSSIEQKTFVKVNREGTKAAAVTWGTLDGTAAPEPTTPQMNLVFDRPFVYAIIDNNTGLPLFIGTVTTL